MFIDHTFARLPTGDARTTVVLTLALLLVAILISIRRDTTVAFMDCSSTNALKGLAAVGIVMHHIYYWVADAPDAVPALSLTGQMGVAVFLTFSGYGLQRSYLRRINDLGVPFVRIRPLSSILLGLTLVVSALSIVFGPLEAVLPLLVTFCLIASNRTNEPLLTNYLGTRLPRLYVLVVLIGVFSLVGRAISDQQPFALEPTLRALSGADMWFIPYLLTWYVVFALSWLIQDRFRIAVLFSWGLAWAFALTLAGRSYPASFAMAFPVGCLLAEYVNSSNVSTARTLKSLRIVSLASLSLTVMTMILLVIQPKSVAFARVALLGGLGTTVTSTWHGSSVWLPLARMVPSIVVSLAAVGVCWIMQRAKIRSRPLEIVGRSSLAIYLLNFGLLIWFDPILYRGPLILTQWPAIALVVTLAILFTTLDDRIQSMLRRTAQRIV